jgi:hypothetical protein
MSTRPAREISPSDYVLLVEPFGGCECYQVETGQSPVKRTSDWSDVYSILTSNPRPCGAL